MTTLDLIAALIVAVHRNDTCATPRLLEQLEARLPLEEVLELLEAKRRQERAPIVYGRGEQLRYLRGGSWRVLASHSSHR